MGCCGRRLQRRSRGLPRRGGGCGAAGHQPHRQTPVRPRHLDLPWRRRHPVGGLMACAACYCGLAAAAGPPHGERCGVSVGVAPPAPAGDPWWLASAWCCCAASTAPGSGVTVHALHCTKTTPVHACGALSRCALGVQECIRAAAVVWAPCPRAARLPSTRLIAVPLPPPQHACRGQSEASAVCPRARPHLARCRRHHRCGAGGIALRCAPMHQDPAEREQRASCGASGWSGPIDMGDERTCCQQHPVGLIRPVMEAPCCQANGATFLCMAAAAGCPVAAQRCHDSHINEGRARRNAPRSTSVGLGTRSQTWWDHVGPPQRAGGAQSCNDMTLSSALSLAFSRVCRAPQ